MPFRADRFVVMVSLASAGGAMAQDVPPAEVAAASGPLGTSGEAKRYDAVGLAGAADAVDSPIDAAHATLAVGSVAEVTALETGRTILVPIAARAAAGSGEVIALAPGALAALGVAASAGVRVRGVTPSPQDRAALRAGQPGVPRLAAPPALLNGLRKQMAALPAAAVAAKPAPLPRPAPAAPLAAKPAAPRPAPVAAGSWFVQVAALSSAPRARALADQLNGQSVAAGSLWRVRLGPYPDAAAANAARAGVAARGYRDATVFRSPTVSRSPTVFRSQ